MLPDEEFSDLESLWNSVVSTLELSVSKLLIESYVKKSRLVEIQPLGNNKLKATVACASVFHVGEFQRRMNNDVENAFFHVLEKQVEVFYVVDKNKPEPKSDFLNGPLFEQGLKSNQNSLVDRLKQSGLKPELSLSNFAVSSSNEMAYAAAKAVAQDPGKAYNPLFLYGGVGVGKTHLMQGIGQEIVKKAEVRLIYCSGEVFTNEIIDAIRNKSTPKFRKRYRSVKVLLIDDIQFIAGKTAVQEEFFHTFNTITSEDGQVIMTSDKPPVEIDRLEDRLRSRFEGGLTIDIGQPDFELRSAIVMIKSKQVGLRLTSEVAQAIASRETDTRTLLGTLQRMAAFCKTKNKKPSVELAERIVEEMSGKETRVVNSPESLIGLVCDFFQSDMNDVKGPKRHKHIALPRHVAMYLLKNELSLGLVEIGARFNGRDHTSVMHAVNKIEGLIKSDTDMLQKVNQLRNQIGKN